jgi:hypothetical protein
MISIITILCVTGIILTLVSILEITFSFHEEDVVVEIDIREKRKKGSL